jgi:SAM-dependent methyltransferase
VITHFGEGTTFVGINLMACANGIDEKQRLITLDFLKDRKCKTVLDFGGGLGSTALLYLCGGISEVWLGDISDKLLNFANWRAKKRGYHLFAVNLTKEPLPVSKFDCVTAFQCFEYIEKPIETIDQIIASIKPEGFFSVFTNYNKNDSKKPWNIRVFPDFLFNLRFKYGLKKVYWMDYPNQIHAIFQKTTPAWYNFVFYFVDSIKRSNYYKKSLK